MQIEIPLGPVLFTRDEAGRQIRRSVALRRGGRHLTLQQVNGIDDVREPASAFDLSWLRSNRRPRYGQRRGGTVRMADLFCGAGGLTLGAVEAGRAVGVQIDPVFAADTEPHVREAYCGNFLPDHFEPRPLEKVLDGELRDAPTVSETALLERIGVIDLLVGGPPCQGHSNLNNHTRRNDPKNRLYDRMARFTKLFRPKHLIIENVHGAWHDEAGVVQETARYLDEIGYDVSTGILHGELIGLPQTRHRFFLVASLKELNIPPSISNWERLHGVDEIRTFDWACGVEEFSAHAAGENVLDRVTKSTEETMDRIGWLFENREYDLPDSKRPDCHKTKSHTYVSVYGRIHPDRPAPTMTTGFTVMGQGRFVHPHFRRTITPREGARLQFFPDWFWFGDVESLSRRQLVSLIGNAVPPKMAYVLALELLR